MRKMTILYYVSGFKTYNNTCPVMLSINFRHDNYPTPEVLEPKLYYKSRRPYAVFAVHLGPFLSLITFQGPDIVAPEMMPYPLERALKTAATE